MYEATLRDIDHVAGLDGSFACIEPRQGGAATVIASTIGPCVDRSARGDEACNACRAQSAAGETVEGERKLLRFPLRDREHHYGMLRLALPADHGLEDWQCQLVEALSRHIGMALGAARRGEQERLLALQEERSVIARELHDSLAQSLSYMKIQMSLLQRALADPARLSDADTILGDLRNGVNDAYRQLRELLVSFRLELSGDLRSLLRAAVAEYGERADVDITLDIRLAGCSLTPNQEVHVLQIVREALSNMLRHALARHARVGLECDEAGYVTVAIEDDGVGIDEGPIGGRDHHGLSIMRERARSLGGTIEIGRRSEGGTRVGVRFRAVTAAPASAQSSLPAIPPAFYGHCTVPARKPPMSEPSVESVLIVDDHPLFRKGLAQLLQTVPGFRLVGEAAGGEEGIEMARARQPDLVLLDLNMRDLNGLEVLRQLRQLKPEPRVVMITVSDQGEDVVAALRGGADGYLLKDMEPEAMLEALADVAAGRVVIPPQLNHLLAAALRSEARPQTPDAAGLTEQETRILEKIAAGLSNKMIGRELDIAEGTVKVHVKHILRKLDLRSRVEAAVWAVAHLRS